MKRIPERAFVIAERLRARQSSESDIHAALVEFELSAKQIKEVLKKTEVEGSIIQIPNAEQGYFNNRQGNPFFPNLRGTVGTPSVGKKPSLKEEIKVALTSGGAKLLLYIVLSGSLLVLGYLASRS
jgi:hypothetical protein